MWDGPGVRCCVMYCLVPFRSSQRRFAPVVFVLGCLFALGCESNGVMELELNLPPAPAAFDVGPCVAGECNDVDGTTCEADRCIFRGRWYSQVEISTFEFVGDTGVPLQWNLTQTGLVEAIPLGAAGEDARWSCTSVVGDPSVETIRVRLRYCRTINCSEGLTSDLQHWYEIERPFYAGRRTHVRRVAPLIQPSPSRCADDSECATADGGPVCLDGGGTCGCNSDSQCPAGHCEGLDTPLGEGRCTIDVGRCNVLGCIATDDPLEATDVCISSPNPGEPMEHPCERSSAMGIDYVRPGGAGCFGLSM